MRRRRFLKQSAKITAAMLLPLEALLSRRAFALANNSKLSYLAHRTTKTEGDWQLRDCEGQWPKELRGSLFRLGAGQKENYGVDLKHFFDGDPYLSRFDFDGGAIRLRSKFLETEYRRAEKSANKMLYHEFGTKAPRAARDSKIQPNINLLKWGTDFFALSESGAPTKINPDTGAVIGVDDFAASLPRKVTFTAHPKIDPRMGEGYAFGLHQGFDRALKVYRMNPSTRKLEELYSLPQKKIYSVHDFLITENYLVFVIPPLYFNLVDVVLGHAPLADALRFDGREDTRILVLARNGQAPPIEIRTPSFLAFHHGNAYEENGQIIFHSFVAEDASVYNLLKDWRVAVPPPVHLPRLTAFNLDLKKKKALIENSSLENCDFPAINELYRAQKSRFLYCARIGQTSDPLAFTQIIKYDCDTKNSAAINYDVGQTCGEPVFVARSATTLEDDGWLLVLGYDQNRDESFLDCINALTLTRQARVWAGHAVPLGFHGSFV